VLAPHTATTELLLTAATKAIRTADSWGESVFIPIQNVGDLVAAKSKYKHSCQIRFQGVGLQCQ